MQQIISLLDQTPPGRLQELKEHQNQQQLLQVVLSVLQQLLKQMLQLFYRIST